MRLLRSIAAAATWLALGTPGAFAQQAASAPTHVADTASTTRVDAGGGIFTVRGDEDGRERQFRVDENTHVRNAEVVVDPAAAPPQESAAPAIRRAEPRRSGHRSRYAAHMDPVS